MFGNLPVRAWDPGEKRKKDAHHHSGLFFKNSFCKPSRSKLRAAYTLGKPGKDSVYIKMVALTDLKETAVGKPAMQKRPGTPTAAFGEMLVQDHSKSTAELGRFMAKGGLAHPAEMDDKGERQKAGLESLEGRAFDREFARMMVEGHNKAIALMKEIVADASDAELKAWASGKIQVLERHLGHALALQKEPGQK